MRKTLWTLFFISIVLLTCSHVLLDFSPKPWLMGLPFWLCWYMFLHALLIGGILLFIKNLKEE